MEGKGGLTIPREEGEGEGGMGKRIEGEGQNKTLRGVGRGEKGKDNPKPLGFGKVQCIYAKLGTIMWPWRFSTSNQQNQEQRGKFMVCDKRKGTIGGKLSKYNTCLVVVKKTQLAQFF